MDQLGGWLRAEARRRLVWGDSDCLHFPADWLAALGLPDPAAPWRGTYRDEAGAMALLHASGGVVALMQTALQPLAVPRLTHGVRPARGDVGAVTVHPPGGPVVVGAVCAGERWAGRAPGGIWLGRAEPVAVWRPGGL